jgi:hypothetical protein
MPFELKNAGATY